ncbi:MAG TPA: RNA polymerase sigma factor [Acidobacteriota bacterium]|nr:RNA polymerase sigma factor [Acidobacteriota bacterium]
MEAALQNLYRIQMIEETVIEDSDAGLMLRFKDGDAEAFTQLFARHTRPIINFAYRFVRNRGLAEDLAQEIFLRVYEAGAGYQAKAKFTTWLYRIATNVCLNEIRKPHVRTALKNMEDGGGIPETEISHTASAPVQADRLLEQQTVSRALKRSLDELPEKQRAAFILNKYQELSYGEVADIMKISEKAVKSLIHRAKETLAEKLKPLLPGLINI